jgi:uncharacterized damage-inducible protein DinB
MVTLFEQDLGKLAEEVKSYKDEKQIWQTKGEIKNSAGNLCLHLVGNLNHFFGAIIRKSAYVRNREVEFSKKDISAAELINEIRLAENVVIETLNNLKDDDLKEIYPVQVFGAPMTTGYFILHLYGHLNYHLGQVNYHRRLIN